MDRRQQATVEAFTIGTALQDTDHAQAAYEVGRMIADHDRYRLGLLIAAQHQIIRRLLANCAEWEGVTPEGLWAEMALDYQAQLVEAETD